RTVVQIPDVHADAAHGVKDVALAANYRSVVAAPIMRDRQPIGAIVVARSPVGFFPDRQVGLLKTFADQAVIALENVRLFKELEARNRDLTATSDILQVISSSPTDVQPVFEAIADSGMRLFDAQGVTVVRYDGELISIAAARGGALGSAAADIERFRAPHRPIAGFPPEQAVLTKAMHPLTQVAADLVCSEEFRRHARQRGFRSVLAVPLLRGGDPVGAIVVSRAQAGPFSTAEIELVHTFADQAVIAIENARLFNETKEALEQQTATSEILRVISNSPTDIQPVLEAVAEAAARLCDSADLSIFRVEEDILHLAVHRGPIESLPPYGDERVSLERGTVVGRSIIERRTIHILDLSTETEEYPEASARARRF